MRLPRSLAVLLSAQVHRVSTDGTVWTIALLLGSGTDGPRMAIGGECPTITVYDLTNHRDVLQLPVDECTFSIAITPDALCYTNGTAASMYGKGGTAYGWRDPPSFGVLASLIMTPLLSEAQLLHCARLFVEAHPAVVNARDPESGASLLQFVICHANQARLLDMLLAARCTIGLQADAKGRTCLSAALEQGKWRSLQQLLAALRLRQLSIIPGSMRLVAECFETLAHDYPRDFLHCISHLPLDAEPEVLGDVDAFDVMLPSVLICGSSQRCPKGIWADKLSQYSMPNHEQDEQFTVPNAFAPPGRPGLSRRATSKDSSSDGSFGRSLSLTNLMGRRSSRTESSVAEAYKAPPEQQRPPGPSSKPVEMGYNKVSRGGLQAFRVPIENFAGILKHGSCEVAPLQLVVDAVDATRDFSVFGSRLMKLLIEFK